MGLYNKCCMFVLLALFVSVKSIGTFDFGMHHLFSDQVKGILAADGWPDEDTLDYYKTLVHRDTLIRGRRLATSNDQTPVTFSDGNLTRRLDSMGFLHYAQVKVGTPAVPFLVALDTGSDLFWLPCDCGTNCVSNLDQSDGKKLKLNIYSPNASTTSLKVACSSPLCGQANRCPSASSDCPYQIRYLSNNTSSTGILVEDALNLITDDENQTPINPVITIGCGQVQTGDFLDGAAPNGLFGLGVDDISVPSVLAKKGIASNSFSMCFGADKTGRISFGDNGTTTQRETPFSIQQPNPTYDITVTQINIGGQADNLEFSAVYDTGTSFTYLTNAVYTNITTRFNSAALDKRHKLEPDLPFEFCYDLRPDQKSIKYPSVDLTMQGGDVYPIQHPIIFISFDDGSYMYCLGIIKSEDIDIIGQNFMTGYKVVFDRERNVLGWTESDCSPANSSTFFPNNQGSPTYTPPTPTPTPTPYAMPPVRVLNPVVRPVGSSSPTLKPFSLWFTCSLLILLWFTV